MTWICLSKEKLILNMSKYDLNMFVKEKVDFKHVQVWLEYVCQKKSWFWTYPNIILSIFVKEKVDFRHIQIWLWVCLSKEKLTINISKYDFEYFC
jgi:hypothetical protein